VVLDRAVHGLLIQTIPYLGRRNIFKVFTADEGLVALISPAGEKRMALAPFLVAEWIYRANQREIHPLKEVAVTEDWPGLKENYERIAAAGEMGRDILRTQAPGKESATLYQLAVAYYRQLSHSAAPRMLAASFRLKLFTLEGQLHLSQTCVECGAPALALCGGEEFCPHHAPPRAVYFAPEEHEILWHLAKARSFLRLAAIPHSPALCEKIEGMFSSICLS
jgi:recombinational DNA repair protein (RecF pathway)